MFNVTFGDIPNYYGIGIYCITNIKNGKQYVGKSIHVNQRIKQHIYSLTHGKCALRFSDDIKNGAHFEFSILEKIQSPSTEGFLYEREKYWAEKLKTTKCGYNKAYIEGTFFPGKTVYADE